ncbi:lysoplasmalogenase [Microbacterium sp. C7(2022)]|uniref:lysoplasmalogenase n=1 Tax=Microbacterium sp. C7(2022) TaxID=2992759 RepID=UPI00237C334C|nr:lysoplasmalogenase [Microbacterium sp. C7(2022)]MDE0546681.1 lysoplasmalogenase [Microbacterium sp. C7(2022)]
MSHPTTVKPRLLVAFAPFAIVSFVHILARALDSDAVSTPTKLLLMPALAFGVWWASRAHGWARTHTLLTLAIFFSWLGDEAALFFPFAPTLPLMLLFFGAAHLVYIWLFQRRAALRPQPGWSALYLLWWGALLVPLWPHLGSLSIAVAVYGLVLVGTAASATRCHPMTAWGGLLFLTSDSILAFRIFLPDAMPHWTDPAVMLTYCAGQGLIAAGVVISSRGTADMKN